MASFFQYDTNQVFSFFAVLVRFSALFIMLPILGDGLVPSTLKILFALATSVVVFPVLVSLGQIDPSQAEVWAASGAGIFKTVGLEALFGVAVGFVARMIFQIFQVGSDIAGNFMGFAAASQFDPHQESQTQVISRFLVAIATLIFLALDGHHLLLKAATESYRFVGMGEVKFGGSFAQYLTTLSGEVLRTGLQISGPMAISFFSVNIIYGVVAKAMPQLNILILSFSVSALVGLGVMFLTINEYGSVATTVFENIGEKMGFAMKALSHQ